jgi:hypothetical protein
MRPETGGVERDPLTHLTHSLGKVDRPDTFAFVGVTNLSKQATTFNFSGPFCPVCVKSPLLGKLAVGPLDSLAATLLVGPWAVGRGSRNRSVPLL